MVSPAAPATTYETQGTIIMRGGVEGDSQDYVEIQGVTAINSVGFQRALIDVTTLRSTQREYRLAIKDGQEIGLELFFDPENPQHQGLRDDNKFGYRRQFKILLTDSPSEEVTFVGLVMNWSYNTAIDSVYNLTVTIKPTGDLVFTSDGSPFF
jgi:hypothetical protein